MAVISTLAVSLTARTEKFRKGMRNATKNVKSFGASVGGLLSKLGPLGAVLTGAGFAAITKQSFSAIDATAKLADRIGTTTEALVGLRHAAEITGAGTETMDKALQFLAKSLGEAKTGVGEAKDAIKLLGLDVGKLIGMDPADVFRAIAEQTNNLATQSEKAFVATKLFGRAGIALVNTLALGAGGLDEMSEEAIKLGLAFNRMEATKIEEANDAVSKLKASFRGIANTISIRLAPLVKALADGVTSLVTGFRGLSKVTKLNIEKFLKMTAAIGSFLFVVPVALRAFKAIASAIKGLTKASAILQALSGPAGWAALATGLAVATASVIAVDIAFADATESISSAAKETQNLVDGLKKIKGAAENSGTAVSALSTQLRQIAARGKDNRFNLRLSESAAGLERMEKLAGLADRLKQSFLTPKGIFRNRLGEITAMSRAGLINIAEAAAATARAQDKFDDAVKMLGAKHRSTLALFDSILDKLSKPDASAIDIGSRGLRSIDLSLEALRPDRNKVQTIMSPQLATLNRSVNRILASVNNYRGGLAP